MLSYTTRVANLNKRPVRYLKWPREPTLLSGVFFLLYGSHLIGLFPFPWPRWVGVGVRIYLALCIISPLFSCPSSQRTTLELAGVLSFCLSSVAILATHMDATLRFLLWHCCFLRTKLVCSVGRAFRDNFCLSPWPLPPPTTQLLARNTHN